MVTLLRAAGDSAASAWPDGPTPPDIATTRLGRIAVATTDAVNHGFCEGTRWRPSTTPSRSSRASADRPAAGTGKSRCPPLRP